MSKRKLKVTHAIATVRTTGTLAMRDRIHCGFVNQQLSG
jgi:hypothetical protein